MQPEMIKEKPPFQVVEYVNSKTYNIYITQAVVEAEKYSGLFDLLRNAGQYDMIRIYINSPGGNMFTGIELINAIKETSAYVITILDGIAMSLAPLILLSGDEIVIKDHSMIMFHDFSTGTEGKGNEIFRSAVALKGYYKNMLEDYAYPFLNKAEIVNVSNGQDLYLDTGEIKKRMKKVIQAKEKELEMEEQEDE